LLLPAVTNCEIDSKTTRQRQQKSQQQFDKDNSKVYTNTNISPETLHRKVSETLHNKRKINKAIIQWRPFHPTDLGPTHIGINPLPGPEQGDLHEAYLLPTGLPFI
jgi:hypothetical protein